MAHTIGIEAMLSLNRIISLGLAAAAAIAFPLHAARAQDAPQLQTNQSYVEDLSRATSLNVDDPMAVFGYVMSKLPDFGSVFPCSSM